MGGIDRKDILELKGERKIARVVWKKVGSIASG